MNPLPSAVITAPGARRRSKQNAWLRLLRCEARDNGKSATADPPFLMIAETGRLPQGRSRNSQVNREGTIVVDMSGDNWAGGLTEFDHRSSAQTPNR